jgi:hypothetical protein
MSNKSDKIDLLIEKVSKYIELEYDIKYCQKMIEKKHINITKGYIKNCNSLNKTIPYIAQGIVRYLKGIN